VATTLTQLALRPWLTQTGFDHVIVDEAAAAQLPHLAHAIGYARTGAVLVGDYLQNGPIVEKSFPGGKEVQDLFNTDCFSFFDATDPRQAQQSDGCVVLTEQFRFGPALTELANQVAYRGILTTAGKGEADIVVVTVDGLPYDVRAIHYESKQAGWWLIGALLARALAEHHYDAGARDAFGVVVPYRAQVDATQAALDDSSLGRATPVGTSHKFQGRQFDTVLADLVEDGNGRMATADLRGNDFAIDSVRLFNVAATRPRSRLYVLVGRRASIGPGTARWRPCGRWCRLDEPAASTPIRCSACLMPSPRRRAPRKGTWWRRSPPTYVSRERMTRTPPSTR
jgi:superfamily I DNA and/or RNA helicase